MADKQTYKESASALRLLLRYPQHTKAVGQFKRISFRGADYIYNSKAGNIIATIRPVSRRYIVRYRPASFYASILANHANYFRDQVKGIAIPSFNLSRQERRIRRFSQNYRPHDRRELIQMIGGSLGKSSMFDGLTMDRQVMRRQRRETVESITIPEGGLWVDTASPIRVGMNSFTVLSTTSGIMGELTEVPETERPQTASPTTNSTGLDETTLRRTLEQLRTSRDPRNPSAE